MLPCFVRYSGRHRSENGHVIRKAIPIVQVLLGTQPVMRCTHGTYTRQVSWKMAYLFVFGELGCWVQACLVSHWEYDTVQTSARCMYFKVLCWWKLSCREDVIRHNTEHL